MLPARWSIQRPGFLMTCAEPMTGDSVLPEGYTLDRAGEEAAIGHVVVVDGFAIYDRIETRPEHRRRGLTRVVMKLLGAIGEAHGARCGVLVAMPDGRVLYESLGWELHSPYITAVIPGD